MWRRVLLEGWSLQCYYRRRRRSYAFPFWGFRSMERRERYRRRNSSNWSMNGNQFDRWRRAFCLAARSYLRMRSCNSPLVNRFHRHRRELRISSLLSCHSPMMQMQMWFLLIYSIDLVILRMRSTPVASMRSYRVVLGAQDSCGRELGRKS